MRMTKNKEEIKKVSDGRFEKITVREEKSFINKRLLLKEKESVERRLKNINNDLKKIEELEKTEK